MHGRIPAAAPAVDPAPVDRAAGDNGHARSQGPGGIECAVYTEIPVEVGQRSKRARPRAFGDVSRTDVGDESEAVIKGP